MTTEDRRQRSDTMELLLEADVTVYPPGGQTLPAKLKDVTAGEVSVLFIDSGVTPPPEGQKVRLKILLNKLARPMNIVATAMEHMEREGRVACTFRFTHMATVDRTLPPDIYSVFNRRQMFRVRPDPKQPMMVKLSAAREGARTVEIEVQLTDVSGSGVGLFLGADVAGPFALSSLLELELELPGDEQPLRFSGRICYRLDLGRRWRLGIEFDARKTKHFHRKQQRIMLFIMQRQRDLLKMTTNRFSPV